MIAVVLAGGPPDALVAAEPELANKAFLPIGGIALVERTIAPLRATPGVERIIAVAPPSAHGSPALADADEIRADGPRIADSLRSGIAGLDPDALVLITAADLPVLTVVAIEEFWQLAIASDADVAYACVEQRTHPAKYPAMPHTWARFKEGVFCGGGAIALRPRVFSSLERFLDRLGNARKNPAALAAIFGWDVVAKYAIGRLSIAEAEQRAGKLLGAPIAAAICGYPEIAVNVDRPSDVELANALVRAG